MTPVTSADNTPDYVRINLASWDERAPAHAGSPDYDRANFLADPRFLSKVVSFDTALLGSIDGLRVVHLQCHIGTDTLSLARLGASMTGLDFSSAAIEQARSLAKDIGTEIEYVEGNVYSAAEMLGRGEFDLVYTGVGALCWLPNIVEWAQVVADLLKPGGRLFIREGHPMMWALDEIHEDRMVIDYPYFETVDPIVSDEEGTYVATDVQFRHNLTHSWNHGIGEIVMALKAVGMELTSLIEHQSVPWEALPGQMVQDEQGEWRLKERPERLAATYTLQAVKAS